MVKLQQHGLIKTEPNMIIKIRRLKLHSVICETWQLFILIYLLKSRAHIFVYSFSCQICFLVTNISVTRVTYHKAHLTSTQVYVRKSTDMCISAFHTDLKYSWHNFCVKHLPVIAFMKIQPNLSKSLWGKNPETQQKEF